MTTFVLAEADKKEFVVEKEKKINKAWTLREIEYLKNNYNNLTAKELAEKLGRTVGSVTNKAQELGLKKNDEYAVYRNGEIIAIGTIEDLSERLNLKRETLF